MNQKIYIIRFFNGFEVFFNEFCYLVGLSKLKNDRDGRKYFIHNHTFVGFNIQIQTKIDLIKLLNVYNY